MNSRAGAQGEQTIGPKSVGASLAGLSFSSKKETDLREAYANQVAEVNALLAIVRAHDPAGLDVDPDKLEWGHVLALDDYGYKLRRVVESFVAEDR